MDRIQALVEDALGSELGSAAAVSVGDSGRQVFELVRGHARRVPDRGPAITRETRFDLASLTKPIATVASAMVLVGDGKLDLAAPVRRWLPDAQTTGSVRELLGHAAGCAAHVEFFRRLRAERPADPRAALVAMAARERCDPPGVQAVYSDLGFIQLGAVIERAAGAPLEQTFSDLVGGPLGLTARYAPVDPAGAVATELDERGLVCGRVHDENADFGGSACGHAGLFATIGDVAAFAAAIVAAANGDPRGRLRPDIVTRFFTENVVGSWRLGWDRPAHELGVSQAGDRWPRTGAVGHTGFTGTSLWLDLPRRRWVALLTNRVHPTRFGDTAARIKALRRAVNDAALEQLDR